VRVRVLVRVLEQVRVLVRVLVPNIHMVLAKALVLVRRVWMRVPMRNLVLAKMQDQVSPMSLVDWNNNTCAKKEYTKQKSVSHLYSYNRYLLQGCFDRSIIDKASLLLQAKTNAYAPSRIYARTTHSFQVLRTP
jgi:hypothetical protein